MSTPSPRHARRAALSAIAAITVYLIMVFGTLAQLQALSGLVPLDLRPTGYSAEEARALLAALGAEGRNLYLKGQLVLDLLYPPLLALTLASLYALLGRDLSHRWVVNGAIAVSWLSAALDYLENAGIAAMLLTWNDLSDDLVQVTSAATLAKSATTTMAMTGLLVLAAWALWRKATSCWLATVR